MNCTNQNHSVENPIENGHLGFIKALNSAPVKPLDIVQLSCNGGEAISVLDGCGREYFKSCISGLEKVEFVVGGNIGTHTVKLFDKENNLIDSIQFDLDAKSQVIDNKGVFQELFQILDKTMRCYSPDGNLDYKFKGQDYKFFVPWILDQVHTAKGMQYLSPYAAGLVDLLRQVQREDGMIWSNTFKDMAIGNLDTAYEPDGYFRREKDLVFSRQPVENHCEYNYVNCVYIAWKGNGDEEWLTKTIDSAVRALNYTINDKVRWSDKFQLLKRGYTIDSWDFQIDDKYKVDMGLSWNMRIDAERTKFGVFFGDNTGYAEACMDLAEMLDHLGRNEEANVFKKRSEDILKRLSFLSWNGRFFVHRIEEDETVIRDLGVDEKSQIAMSNCYSINRGITHEQSKAIIESYIDLSKNLPDGSPGEWYSIYPPFLRGFGGDNEKWEYMNAGVHGHAAGELARGAFKNGYEQYAAGILTRIANLAKDTNGIVSFAYTGAYEQEPPLQEFTQMSLAEYANMDLWDIGSKDVPNWMFEKKGNDMRNLPVDSQILAGVPYYIADPETNDRKSVIGVRSNDKVKISIDKKAGAIYLLLTGGKSGDAGIYGCMTLKYKDGTTMATYLVNNKHLANYWYPQIQSKNAGIAWEGPNEMSKRVGMYWCAIENKYPDKRIKSISFSGSKEDSIYVLAGLTLADRMPFTPVPLVSFGGPDNWSGGTCMFALIEGLAGVEDKAATTMFEEINLSPRWQAADVSQVYVIARYEASKGYVCYKYKADESQITIILTGSGAKAKVNVLLPKSGVKSVRVDGIDVGFEILNIEKSAYCSFDIELNSVRTIDLNY